MQHRRVHNVGELLTDTLKAVWSVAGCIILIYHPNMMGAIYAGLLGTFLIAVFGILRQIAVTRLSLADIKESIAHTPSSLQVTLCQSTGLPNDLTRYYIAPMVNFADTRVAPTHRRHHRYYFRHAEVDFGRQYEYNPPIVYGYAATPTETNDRVRRRIILENAPDQPSYLGGYAFQAKGYIWALEGLELIKTSIDKFYRCFKRDGMVVLERDNSYTFLNPAGMSAITVPANGLHYSDRRLLA